MSKILLPRVCFRAVVLMAFDNSLTVRQTLDLHSDQNAEGYQMDLILAKAFYTYPAFEVGKTYSFVADVQAVTGYKSALLKWQVVKAKEIKV